MSQWFQRSILRHFKLEEESLFPFLKEKVEKEDIQNLLFDHEHIIKEFERFKHVKDYDLSKQILKNLTNYLYIHAKKEEDFYHLINLSDSELKKVESRAKHINHLFLISNPNLKKWM